MTDFVINRSQLLTGSALKAMEAAGYASTLYEPKSCLSCVLGQYLQSMGVKTEALKYHTAPSNLTCVLPSEAAWLLAKPREDSKTAEALTAANDSNRLHQTRREAKIVKLFATQRINAMFTGKYADATRRAKRALKN